MRARDLAAKPELNGASATVLGWDGAKGRSNVSVVGSGAVLALKAANLQRGGGGTPPPPAPAEVAPPPPQVTPVPAPVADATPQVAGLSALLDGLGLSDQLPAAAAWCEANGADSVAAIVEVEMVAEFVEALALKPVKAKQVVKRIEAGMA